MTLRRSFGVSSSRVASATPSCWTREASLSSAVHLLLVGPAEHEVAAVVDATTIVLLMAVATLDLPLAGDGLVEALELGH